MALDRSEFWFTLARFFINLGDINKRQTEWIFAGKKEEEFPGMDASKGQTYARLSRRKRKICEEYNRNAQKYALSLEDVGSAPLEPASLETLSTDGRRIHRKQILVEPPSPVKRLRAAHQTKATESDELPFATLSFDFLGEDGATPTMLEKPPAKRYLSSLCLFSSILRALSNIFKNRMSRYQNGATFVTSISQSLFVWKAEEIAPPIAASPVPQDLWLATQFTAAETVSVWIWSAGTVVETLTDKTPCMSSRYDLQPCLHC